MMKPDPAPIICSRRLRKRSRNSLSSGVPRNSGGSSRQKVAARHGLRDRDVHDRGSTFLTSGAKLSGATRADALSGAAAHADRTRHAATIRSRAWRQAGRGAVMKQAPKATGVVPKTHGIRASMQQAPCAHAEGQRGSRDTPPFSGHACLGSALACPRRTSAQAPRQNPARSAVIARGRPAGESSAAAASRALRREVASRAGRRRPARGRRPPARAACSRSPPARSARRDASGAPGPASPPAPRKQFAQDRRACRAWRPRPAEKSRPDAEAATPAAVEPRARIRQVRPISRAKSCASTRPAPETGAMRRSMPTVAAVRDDDAQQFRRRPPVRPGPVLS